MKALRKIAPIAVAVAGFIAASGSVALPAVAMPVVFQGPPPPPPGDEPWNVPPPEYREVERKGFHDGVEGARKDSGNHRRPDVNNRDEFRHPDVPHRDHRAYRDAFARGYRLGVEKFYGGRPY